MIKTKEEYFAASRQLNLPARCPLIEQCERRAQTLALAAGWPHDEVLNRAHLRKPIINTVGEPAQLVGGENNFTASNLCPEVNLFETSSALAGISGPPTTKAEYDKYMTPQFSIKETGHFSQCAEYCNYRKNVLDNQAEKAQPLNIEIQKNYINMASTKSSREVLG